MVEEAKEVVNAKELGSFCRSDCLKALLVWTPCEHRELVANLSASLRSCWLGFQEYLEEVLVGQWPLFEER